MGTFFGTLLAVLVIGGIVWAGLSAKLDQLRSRRYPRKPVQPSASETASRPADAENGAS